MQKTMTPFAERVTYGLAAATLVVFLSACGGGGGSTTSAVASMPASSAWPSSGGYSPVIKVQGSVGGTSIVSALSLVHPANPTVEYVMDGSASLGRVGQFLETGTFNVTSQQITGVTQVAYVDSPSDVMRVTPLTATGARPAQLSGNSQPVCDVKITVRNHTNPFASQMIGSTRGASVVCGGSNDSEVLIRFNTEGVPGVTPITGTTLGYFRSAATGLPTSFVRGLPDGSLQRMDIPSTSGGATATVSLALGGTSGAVFKPVQNINDIVVYTNNGTLMAVSSRSNPSNLTAATLSSVTSPSGWRSAGFDNNNVYAYLNTFGATTDAGVWRILSISRSNLVTSTFATGSGILTNPSIAGGSEMFATILGQKGSGLVRISTSAGLIRPYSTPGALSVVSAAKDGNHVLVNTAADGSLVSTQVINDAGTVLYSAADGFIYGLDNSAKYLVDDTAVPIGNLFFTRSADLGLGGSVITRYDVNAQTTRVIGTLPTGATLGGTSTSNVFATGLFPSAGFGGTYVARSVNSSLSITGSAVYTYNTGAANSLTLTTSQVR